MNLFMHLWFGAGPIILMLAIYIYSRFIQVDERVTTGSKEFIIMMTIAEAFAFGSMWMMEYIYSRSPLIESPFPTNEGFVFGGSIVSGFIIGYMMISLVKKAGELPTT